MTLAIVAMLLVLATRAAAGHPHGGDGDAPTRDDAVELDRELDLDIDEPRELRTFDGAVVDRAEAIDMLERGDHERLPLVGPAPTVAPSWLGRIDVSIAWRRRVETAARSLVEKPAVDQLWLLASWSR